MKSLRLPFLFCLAAFLFSGNRPKPVDDSLAGVKSVLERLKKDPDLASASWGFSLLRTGTGTGTPLLAFDENRTLMPASTMKVVTSAAALGILGKATRLKTTLEYTGEISEGILHGNVFIRGGGDPSLGSDRFEAYPDLDALLEVWAEKISESGIEKIAGAVIGDAQILDSESVPGTWQWMDIGNYYGAGASGLCIHENLYHMHFRSGAKPGSSVEITRTSPEMPGLQFRNEVLSGPYGSGDNAFIYGAPYGNIYYVRGSIPPGRSDFTIKGSMPEPALYAARALTDKLEQKDVDISAPSTTVRKLLWEEKYRPEARRVLHVNEGAEIARIVYWLNKKSVNLFAEQLLRLCGLQHSAKGSIDAGRKAILEYWESKGVDMKGVEIADGSGLSRKNGISPRRMAAMLAVASRESFFSEYLASFPEVGQPDDDGSLANMLAGTSAAGRVFAKSGYISGVRSYAGYVKGKNDKWYAFSMIANQYTCSASEMRHKFEKLILSLSRL